MSAMKNLDLMIQQRTQSPEDYIEAKEMISMNINGEIPFDQLPPRFQQLIYDWESEEMELEYNGLTDDAIEEWDYYNQ